MEKYDHKKIEKKWQERWEQAQSFRAEGDSKKEKRYVLDMFPYPSGSGLHVGHVEGYTATDIYSRFKRMQGYDVLHPMGWDAFGLPAENYAVKTGIPPATTTAEAIKTFRRQIKSLGLSYDWSRELGTHTPEYYAWTQWFFLFLYKKGLAYKKKAFVNWDPVDQTVLANEQVLPDGTAERSGATVVQKELEQWFFKITDFSDALVDDLDHVDWPESTKINQRNWIGRSEGAEIEFSVAGFEKKIKIFTTRPDTLFGATYMVLAPEHALVSELAAKAQNAEEIRSYAEATKNKTDRERQEGEKDKTGVEIKGVRAINPANKEEIPIFIADYVLGNYGTGAIMAVPAHDARDYQFAKKFNLPIKEVIIPTIVDHTNPPREGKPTKTRETAHAVVYDPKRDAFLILRSQKFGWNTVIMGGIDEGEEPLQAALREIREETGYTDVEFKKALGGKVQASYFAKHKDENRTALSTGFYFELKSDATVERTDLDVGDVVWLPAKEFVPGTVVNSELPFWLERLRTDAPYSGEGILVDSGAFSGVSSEEAKKKITEAVSGRMVKTYKLRDWLISRQRYWGAPIPIVYDPEGKAHAVPEEHLPWILPTDVEFKPKGTSPLGQSKELFERTEKIFGKGWRPEIDTMDTFVCSSWYFFRFADPGNTKEFAAKEALRRWLPVDLYMGGAEHTVLHLMYARFFTKVLKKEGLIDFDEPFLKLRHQGTIVAEDGNKMSKSKGNVINPDEVVEKYGADTLRLYEMFMGPLEAMKPWNTKNILGVRRFLERVAKLESGDTPLQGEIDVLLNQTIKKVGDDIEHLKMNTAVSSLMVLLNAFEKKAVPAPAYDVFLQLLAPFAPHLTSELWEKAGHKTDIREESWPAFDSSKLQAKTVKIAVQIDGKVRGFVEVSPESSKEEILSLTEEDSALKKWLPEGALQGGEEGVQVIYVQGKVLSIVTKRSA